MIDIDSMSSAELSMLKVRIEKEIEHRKKSWDDYISYLRDWADDNADPAYAGQSPMGFDEFLKQSEQFEVGF